MAKPVEDGVVDKNLQAEVMANANKVPQSAQTVLVQCQSALYWGGNWSLIAETDQDYAEIAQLMPELRKRFPKEVHVSKVVGGIVLSADVNWLLSIISTLAPNAAAAKGQEYMTRVKETQTKEGEKFKKYWEKTLEGKTPMFNKKDDKGNTRLDGTIGVYCTNVNSQFTVNGIDYPAFKLSPVALCQTMASMPNAQRLHVAVQDKAGNVSWMPLERLMSTGAYGSALSFPKDARGNLINRPKALVMRFAVK